MTRAAAFRRDQAGMRRLKEQAEAALSMAGSQTGDIPQALLFKDILITQRAVLSAMLYAAEEQGSPSGVLMTYPEGSRREPARPLPERDLWFESVWKKCREEQALGAG